MNRQRLDAQLRVDEGCCLRVYPDSRGYPTAGIGHLIHVGEPYKLGDRILRAQAEAWFRADVDQAIADCQRLFPTWQTSPDRVQEVLANMMFNLGRTTLTKFLDLRAAVARHDWPAAADAMVDSRWYRQIGDRSKRLVAAMRAANGSD